MHIFLTGPVQAGKSTAIKKYLTARGPMRLGGFVTVSDFGDTDGQLAQVLLRPAADADGGYRVGLRLNDGGFEAYPAVFDEHGPAMFSGECDLILMDEVGIMERGAEQFSRAVLRTLDGSTPVLGVLKAKSSPLLDSIRSHPNVCIIEVSEANRDSIPVLIEGLMSPALPGVGGLIVSAGLSSRMGDFKPLLPLGGKPMMQHAIENMRRAGAQEIAVVTGHRADELRPVISALGAHEVYNPDYAVTQMFDSIKRGLGYLSDKVGRILMTPVDNPAIAPETFAAVLAENAPIVRPEYKGAGGHPLLFDSRFARFLAIYDGPGGMRGAMDNCGIAIKQVPVDDMGIDLDADTPQEYARLCEYWETRS